MLRPGPAQALTFKLTATDLASCNMAAEAWIADAGTGAVRASASVLNTKQRASFTMPKEVIVRKSWSLLVPQAPIAELKAPTTK